MDCTLRFHTLVVLVYTNKGNDSSTQYCIIGSIGNTEEGVKMIGLDH